jgi:hypothetical protein
VEPMANSLTTKEQYQFESNGETVTVEIDADGSLTFVDYDPTYDEALMEFKYPPTRAILLSALWEDSNTAEKFAACYSNDDFFMFDQWNILGDTEARIILSYSLESGERGSTAALGTGFNLEQRLRMATYHDDTNAISIFLAYYGGDGLTRHKKQELQAMLSPEDKCWLAHHSRRHGESEVLDLILESTDECKFRVLKDRTLLVCKKKRELAILNSITDDEMLARALCVIKHVDGQDFRDQAKRIQDRNWFNYVLQHSEAPEATMLLYEDRQMWRHT